MKGHLGEELVLLSSLPLGSRTPAEWLPVLDRAVQLTLSCQLTEALLTVPEELHFSVDPEHPPGTNGKTRSGTPLQIGVLVYPMHVLYNVTVSMCVSCVLSPPGTVVEWLQRFPSQVTSLALEVTWAQAIGSCVDQCSREVPRPALDRHLWVIAPRPPPAHTHTCM